MTGIGKIRRPWWRRGFWQAAGAAFLIAAAAYVALQIGSGSAQITYRITAIQRGTITEAVSSTGTLSAVGVVQLTSQIAGEVKEVLVDFNAPVASGQVLARLKPETFEVRLIQAEADLAIANASLVSANASVERAHADLRNGDASLASNEAQLTNARISLEAAERELERQQELFRRNVVAAIAVENAQTQYDQARAQFEQSGASLAGQQASQDSRRAALTMAESGIVTADAQVLQREAQLNAARIELEQTVIRSPVYGTVIERSIEAGQTIASGSNSTPLFTIAQSLSQMQVEVSVDEADIGNIRQGMRVTFTVDAYSGREYAGVVQQVRFAPQTVQNVVTYTVVVSAPNPELSLLPGMTATARVILDERTSALRLPNAALRYEPVGFEASGGGAARPGGGAGRGGGGGAPPGAGAPPGGAPPGGGAGRPPGAAAGGAVAGNGGGNGPRLGGGAGAGGPGGQLAALGLSEVQQQQVQEALAGVREGVAALRQQGAGPEQIQGALAEGNRQAILAVLTPEQRQRFEARQQAQAEAPGEQAAPQPAAPLRRARSARVFVLGENGKPVAVAVQIGITDGGFTELVRGDLAEGQEVITGSDEAAVVESPGGFRFGFF